ncbi:MAG: alpha/beta hydrolase [Parcubacteria group bacterium]|nr:alpha/beta hydrolase [Parcubacteria group bacterium]
MLKQVVFIHGGDAFASYEKYLEALRNVEYTPSVQGEKRWKHTLAERLGPDFEVLAPAMPCKDNAKYTEWKIWFEKVLPYVHDGVVLIGHSLGGLFLAKYLSENEFPKEVRATFLVGAVFDEDSETHSVGDFDLPASLEHFAKHGGDIFLYHSEDDPVVPVSAVEKYGKALPDAEEHIFADRGHFLQGEFPELVERIKNLFS